MTHKHYIYIYCDPRKKGIFKYDGIDIIFNYEPFYVGMGYGYRYKRHVTNYEIKLNYNTIKNGKIKHIIEGNFDPLKYVIFYSENISRDEAIRLETLLIKILGRIDNKTGILSNLSDGGDGSSGIKSGFKGKTYEEIYGIEKAIKLKNEKRKKLIGNKFGGHNKGKVMSDEQKKNLSKIKSIPVKQLDKNNNLIKIWDSCKEAANFLNISVSGIHNTLNDNMPAKSAGGYRWEFTNRINNKYKI